MQLKIGYLFQCPPRASPWVIMDTNLSPCKGKSLKVSGWGKPELIDKYELQEVELRLPIPKETGGQTGGQTGSPKTIEKFYQDLAFIA